MESEREYEHLFKEINKTYKSVTRGVERLKRGEKQQLVGDQS